MNFCTKCGSVYSKPGTCNCFAGSQPQPLTIPAPTYVPYYPSITPAPYQPYYPYTVWCGTLTSGGVVVT